MPRLSSPNTPHELVLLRCTFATFSASPFGRLPHFPPCQSVIHDHVTLKDLDSSGLPCHPCRERFARANPMEVRRNLIYDGADESHVQCHSPSVGYDTGNDTGDTGILPHGWELPGHSRGIKAVGRSVEDVCAHDKKLPCPLVGRATGTGRFSLYRFRAQSPVTVSSVPSRKLLPGLNDGFL